jgi:hypothetical protein
VSVALEVERAAEVDATSTLADDDGVSEEAARPPTSRSSRCRPETCQVARSRSGLSNNWSCAARAHRAVSNDFAPRAISSTPLKPEPKGEYSQRRRRSTERGEDV